MSERWVGARVRRREDPRLVHGRGAFTGDLALPGLLHAAVVRSPHAHARIVSVDADAARRAPAVAGVLANAVADALAPLGVEITEIPLTRDRLWRSLRARTTAGR